MYNIGEREDQLDKAYVYSVLEKIRRVQCIFKSYYKNSKQYQRIERLN